MVRRRAPLAERAVSNHEGGPICAHFILRDGAR
jgi:hypothetical protein